jgi:hypothetical protein
MEAGLAGLADDALDAVHQRGGRGAVVARDVVQRHVAEAALLPVAAVRHGELVPAPVGPQPVHRVQHVQQRQILVQRQAVPGRRADFGKGDVRLDQVHIAHRVLVLDEGAHQPLLRALALQVLQQRQQRPLAGVQRHIVEVVEHPHVAQFAQLGVDEAAAQHGDKGRVLRLQALRDAKGRIHRARERHREQHQLRLVALQRLQGQRVQALVDQVQRRGQRLGQRVEGRLALRQLLGIAHEFETRVDRIAQHVGQVVQIQRGQMPGAVLQAQAPKAQASGSPPSSSM